jgi:CRISPR/Cas system CSM-associated protein Csm3 (group 7 of RAMP superfamily)
METKTIKYSITFLSDWHAGSGLSAGAESDATVIKDSENLPYLPGKTIKGLLKDALMDIVDVNDKINKNTIDQLFGRVKDDASTEGGKLYFSNASISDNEKAEISVEMSQYLYRNLSSTTIDENGVTKKGSLRTMEVTYPIALHGEIVSNEYFKDNEIELLQNAMKWTRSLGSNRNRGLGRCKFHFNS